jgi:hypothetical protein
MISNRKIREIIREYWNEPVSGDVIEYVRVQCEDYARNICKHLVDEFNEQNRLRKVQRLRELKKLSLSEYGKLSEIDINPTIVNSMDSAGESNRKTADSKQDIEVV